MKKLRRRYVTESAGRKPRDTDKIIDRSIRILTALVALIGMLWRAFHRNP